MNASFANSTVVMVHGAWADGSCWSNVILPLRRQGLRVTTAPIPLTSLTEDAAGLRRVIERTTGPVILVGHAYAGAVIAAAHDERVKSLVYIAALAPDEGETVADVFYRTGPHPKAPKLTPDANGLIWMPDEGFGCAVAHKASPDQIAIMAAVQRPIAVQCIQEKRAGACMENDSVLVSGRRRRPHDRPGNPAVYGWPNGSRHSLTQGRPHSYVYCAGTGGGHHPGSCPMNGRGHSTIPAEEEPVKASSVALVTGASRGAALKQTLVLCVLFAIVRC